VIERLTRRHPRIRFQITTGAQPLLYRDLTARNIELAVVRIIKDLTEEHMIVAKLFDDSMVVVAGMKNPWTRRRHIKLAELIDEFWTLPSFDTFSGALLADAFRACGLKPPRPTVITSSNHMRYRLLATGKFLTVFPRYSLTPSLRALPVELPNSRGTIAIVALRSRTLSPVAQLFIEYARDLGKPRAKKKR
jgi:DNA-binding transcriptional LysR family regulator